MKRQYLALAASLVCLLAANGSASAQYYPYPTLPHYNNSFGNQTALSPYLNLLRGGDAAANYYLGVVPEFQRRANYGQLRTAIQEAETNAATALQGEGLDLSKPLSATGHPTAFGYYSSYYPTPGRPGVGGQGTLGRPYR